ncbi:hypothetical protein ACFV29_36670 [Streptomyces sp. NPDC059690]|uniref:hypothetical protein n=1 Tax=Streptomyces sp. NPDC059690 TaxID=3346907 RepID=UPI0036962D9F
MAALDALTGGVRGIDEDQGHGPQPCLHLAEHLPLRDGNGEPTAVEALLASFRIVRYVRDAEAGDRTGVRRRLNRRTPETAV